MFSQVLQPPVWLYSLQLVSPVNSLKNIPVITRSYYFGFLRVWLILEPPPLL